MRGIRTKWRNLRLLLAKRRRMRLQPESVRFERMTPIVKVPFTPDDDAIVATNALDIGFFLNRLGCEISWAGCTDRHVPRPVDWLLNLTPMRFGMLNAFVVARKRG
jgi:hypothetical protein